MKNRLREDVQKELDKIITDLNDKFRMIARMLEKQQKQLDVIEKYLGKEKINNE